MTASSGAGAAIAAPWCPIPSQTGTCRGFDPVHDRHRARHHPADPRQTEILAHVTFAGGALSTSDVRVRVNEQRRTPLVAEQVYRALRALQDRGLVERVHIHGTNKAHWQAPVRAIREAS